MPSKKNFNLHIDTNCDNEVNTEIVHCDTCGVKIDEPNDEHIKKHAYLIIPHLYLGNIWNAKNSVELSKLNIHTIINMTYEMKNYYPTDYYYINYPWHDWLGYQILNDLDNICDQINKLITQKCNVLVHCKMGISRSVTVILAYLIKYNKMSFTEAHEYVKSIKDSICPNDTFVDDLIIFSKNTNIQ